MCIYYIIILNTETSTHASAGEKEPNMKKKWTVADIEQLRRYYLEQKSIKAMAQLLGHTPTAINKSLSRFNIRPISQKTFFSLTKKESKSEKMHIPSNDEIRRMVLKYAADVLCYKIVRQTQSDRYLLNNDPVTFAQILLRVNMHRVANKLPVLTLEDH